jgi:hypothetical protein
MTTGGEMAIEQMSYEEIVRHLNGLSLQSPLPIWTALTQRLYEIALFDHHVPYEHREDAWERLDTVKAFVEEGFKEFPDALAKYRAANQFLEEMAHKCGVGSLGWLIKEHGPFTDEDMFRFIARPEHAHLRETFYSIVGPEAAAMLRENVARYLNPVTDGY